MVDSDVWGSKADLGVGLMTAHLLTMLPGGDGEPSKLLRADGGSPFRDQFDRLAQNVGRAYRVVVGEDEVT